MKNHLTQLEIEEHVEFARFLRVNWIVIYPKESSLADAFAKGPEDAEKITHLVPNPRECIVIERTEE